jgi:hypothetical protein
MKSRSALGYAYLIKAFLLSLYLAFYVWSHWHSF